MESHEWLEQSRLRNVKAINKALYNPFLPGQCDMSVWALKDGVNSIGESELRKSCLFLRFGNVQINGNENQR